MDTVSIAGLDKADVLAALYNAAAPFGLGHLRAENKEMTREEAQELLGSGDDLAHMFPTARDRRGDRLYFDYVKGRPLKIDITGDELRTSLYDRDQGQGKAARVIEELRKKTER